MKPNEASRAVIGAALRVHTAVGAGMLERAIHACLICELSEIGLRFEHEVPLPVTYKQIKIPLGYRVDFVVEDCLLVEIKCVEKLAKVHLAQMLSYLKLTGYKLGLVINFNVPHLRHGIHRVINGSQSEL